MYYKLTLEQLDHDKNIIKGSSVMLVQEFVDDGETMGVDYIKLAADELIYKFRHEHNEKPNENN